MNSFLHALLLPVMLIAWPLRGAAETLPPAFLLERGILEETVELDPVKALGSYRAAASHPDVGPRTQVEAWFRLAECHDTMGHALSAWVGFDQVIHTPQASPTLRELAQEQQIELLIEMVEDESQYSASTLHYVGDLLIRLDGALRHGEASRSKTFLEHLPAPLESLREEAKNEFDVTLLDQMLTDAFRLKAWVEESQFDAASKHLATRSYRDAFLRRPALSDIDEVLGYALEYVDEVLRALNEGQAIAAHQHLQTLQAYLRPLSPWPLGDLSPKKAEHRVYLARLNALAKALEAPLLKNALSTARHLTDPLAELHRETPMPHWHLSRSLLRGFINPEVLPHYAAASLHLESMQDALRANEWPAAAEALRKAMKIVDGLRQEKRGTSDEAGADQLHEKLRRIRQALRDEDAAKALELLDLDPRRARNLLRD